MNTLDSINVLEDRINKVVAKLQSTTEEKAELETQLKDERTKNQEMMKEIEILQKELDQNEKMKLAIRDKIAHLIKKITMSATLDEDLDLTDIISGLEDEEDSQDNAEETNQAHVVSMEHSTASNEYHTAETEDDNIDFYSEEDLVTSDAGNHGSENNPV